MIIPRLVQPFIQQTPNINWTAAIKPVFGGAVGCFNIRIAKLVLGPMDRCIKMVSRTFGNPAR